MLESETLDGDNQWVVVQRRNRHHDSKLCRYFCSQCESLQDAERQTELRELPPVLHFSLLRFIYDFSTMERKKSKQSISFPRTLNMSRFTTTSGASSGDPSNNHEYHLRGVLQHKGPSAYHGHYEAQIFDVEYVSHYQSFTICSADHILRLGHRLGISSMTRPSPRSSPWFPKINSWIGNSLQSAWERCDYEADFMLNWDRSAKSQLKPKANVSKKKTVIVDSDIEIIEWDFIWHWKVNTQLISLLKWPWF